ncbi:MAG: electron transport complex subunit RsxC, partial [Myxococcota bacterium]
MRLLWDTFRHGVHPPDNKALTAGIPIRRLPFPDEIVLPLRQHAGRPARPIVREGDRVERGDTLAEADGHLSAPIHASAAGRISAIGLWPHPEGVHAPAIRIAVEPYSPQALRPRIIPAWEGLSREELIA